MEYFDVRDLNQLQAVRRLLLEKLTTITLKVGRMKHVTMDAELLARLLALKDEENYLQRSTDGSPATMRGLQVIGRAGMGTAVEVSDATRHLKIDFDLAAK